MLPRQIFGFAAAICGRSSVVEQRFSLDTHIWAASGHKLWQKLGRAYWHICGCVRWPQLVVKPKWAAFDTPRDSQTVWDCINSASSILATQGWHGRQPKGPTRGMDAPERNRKAAIAAGRQGGPGQGCSAGPTVRHGCRSRGTPR
jgi:hypothetical protein